MRRAESAYDRKTYGMSMTLTFDESLVVSSDSSTVGISNKLPPIGAHSNHVKLGLVGMPNVGKSTLFNSFIKNPAKVLLKPEEEVGLALLIRGSSRKPLESGEFGRLTGEARAAADCA